MVGKLQVRIGAEEGNRVFRRKAVFFAAEVNGFELRKKGQFLSGFFCIGVLQAAQVQFYGGVLGSNAAGKLHRVPHLDKRVLRRPVHQFMIAGAAAEIGGNQ